jgi:glyoxylase-like metal-dependent hydrolase (beta-lactamase superfamily II)
VLEDDRLGLLGILCVRALNPGPFTLSGTNTWVVGRDPAFVIDPGPALDSHLDRLSAALEARGGLGGVVLTHDHPDHSEAVPMLRARFPAPLAAASGEVDSRLLDGSRFGPLTAFAMPGHAPDHLALIMDRTCFTGDGVLGEGSVFIAPDPSALRGYLDALERLRQFELEVLCPGHGPTIWEPEAKLREYVEHRLHRERRLLLALAQGARTTEQLLDGAWPEVAPVLRPAAAVTLAAHLDKLAEEQRLPEGVERP